MLPSHQRHTQLAYRLLQALGSRSRVIPLHEDRPVSILQTPDEFHSRLIDGIRNAKQHISLASLYIGHGASKQEQQLLQALNEARVPKRVLMDVNRATRPIVGKKLTTKTSIAKEVQSVLDDSPLHLYQVLSPWLARLPSPLNEVSGVFHLKSYIMDDELILSGANLSTEYFVDRQDRYLSFREAELVAFYKDLVEILCDNSTAYDEASQGNGPSKCANQSHGEKLQRLFAPAQNLSALDAPDDVIAYAIPTLQVPNQQPPFPSDVQQISQLLSLVSDSCSVQLASAYLNPTSTLLDKLSTAKNNYKLLTAARSSHGFAPKPGVKRTGDFVPSFFDAQNYNLLSNERCHLLLYERMNWTFHAKGLWITNQETGALVAAVVGSGNYGHRSEFRDLEANLILIFPHPTSSLQCDLLEEWQRLQQYAKPATQSIVAPPEPHIRTIWPLVQSYF